MPEKAEMTILNSVVKKLKLQLKASYEGWGWEPIFV
jgi:hypothetical protein